MPTIGDAAAAGRGAREELITVSKDPATKQALKNTVITVVDQTPIGPLRVVFNAIPGLPDLKADEETEEALNNITLIKVSNWYAVIKFMR